MSNTYDMDAQSFASQMKAYEELPVRYVGGCCGTTPAFIKALTETLVLPAPKVYMKKQATPVHLQNA